MSYLESVRDEYLTWVKDSKYLILNKFNSLTGTSEVFGVLCSKRGNATYKRRILARFGRLSRSLSKLHFFDPTSRLTEYTPALFITLTYNTKLCTIPEAWERIAKEFNNFRAKLHQQYGKLSLIRVFESTINGYPHIHAVIVFQNHLFPSSRKWSRRANRYVWRIPDADNKLIKSFWHSPNSDIQAVNSMGSPLRYLRKYLSKSIDIQGANNATINTLALTWKHKRRSFALSTDLIKALHNSNPIRKTVTQTDLLGNKLNNITLTVVGVVPSSLLALEKDQYFIKLTPEQSFNAWEYCLKRQKH